VKCAIARKFDKKRKKPMQETKTELSSGIKKALTSYRPEEKIRKLLC